jgi:hypothetical protein
LQYYRCPASLQYPESLDQRLNPAVRHLAP